MTLKRKFEEKFSGAVSPYHIGYCLCSCKYYLDDY